MLRIVGLIPTVRILMDRWSDEPVQVQSAKTSQLLTSHTRLLRKWKADILSGYPNCACRIQVKHDECLALYLYLFVEIGDLLQNLGQPQKI